VLLVVGGVLYTPELSVLGGIAPGAAGL
jgi:hypothetical protein